jgi:hypothetical protein
MEDSNPTGGLVSPNRAFTVVVLVMTAIAVGPLAIVLPRWRGGLLGSGLIFALTFGWAMPWLASIGPDER